MAEKRQARAETARAERAFNDARMQPLAIQQAIARCALQECSAAMGALAFSRRPEPDALCRLRLIELEQKINATMGPDPRSLEPTAITAILAQTLLAVSCGSRTDDDMEEVGTRIAQWMKTILPNLDSLDIPQPH
ncbi:MAG: hypothetical protein ACTHLR_05230 [Rhizomicrobium sp.]